MPDGIHFPKGDRSGLHLSDTAYGFQAGNANIGSALLKSFHSPYTRIELSCCSSGTILVRVTKINDGFSLNSEHII